MRGGTLHLVKGESVLVPCCVAVDEESMGVDLQLCCAVALVPHPPLGAGRKALADQSCSHVHVNYVCVQYLFYPISKKVGSFFWSGYAPCITDHL